MPRPCADRHPFYPKTCPTCYTCIDPSPPAQMRRKIWGESIPLEAPQQIRVNMGAGGLGDSLLGLCAVAGLRTAHPEAIIVYRVSSAAIPFVQQFHGWDYLQLHDHDEDDTRTPDSEDIQLNAGYHQEMAQRYPITRLERYRRNAGGVTPQLPTLRTPESLAQIGSPWAGRVVMCPFSHSHTREWSIYHWLTLEYLLESKGYRSLVICEDDERAYRFRGEVLIGSVSNVEQVMGAVMMAACVVGGDTGLTHLGGILHVPTVVLSGPQKGESIYGFYPRVSIMRGGLSCAPCCAQVPFSHELCGPGCSDLASISPSAVLRQVDNWHLPARAGYRSLLDVGKLGIIRDLLRSTPQNVGDLAEIGVYKGGTAKLMQSYAPGHYIHLFDTFSGQPEDDVVPAGWHRKGDFRDTGEAEVKELLSTRNAVFHAGTFPDTADPDLRFAFAHVDMDTFQSTWAAIEYLRPRMVDGGVIVFDDYCWPATPGVAEAIHRSGLKGEKVGEHQFVARFPQPTNKKYGE